MTSMRIVAVAVVLMLAGELRADDPIVVKPHPQAGQFKLKHDPDKPLLGFYGGVGLRHLGDGRWTGYGQTSPADVEYLIRRCTENGIKRIYGSFQEELYPSEVAPASSTSDVDYVALCIKLAHENNIQVYADQPTFAFVEARNAAFLAKHPNVLTRSISGEPDTHMLSAAYPEVRRFKRSIFMEWVKNYPIDGLQLDFIRFPYYSKDIRIGYGKHGYDEPTLAAFRSLYSLPDTYQPRPDDPRWLRMKSEAVTQFIRELRNDLKHSGIELPIGVYNSAHFGRGDSYRTVHQDWRTWEQEGLVDEHSPMFYLSNGMTNLAGSIQSLAAVKRPQGRIIGPLFLSEGFDAGEVPSAELVRDAARRLIKLGCDELWFCRASDVEQFELWPVVKEISQWSIRDIRAQQFDPAYENLLRNGGFESQLDGWAVEPGDASTVAVNPRSESGGAFLRVSGIQQPVKLSQTIRFRPRSHLPVDTLSFAMAIRTSDHAAETPTLTVRLKYLDGTDEEITPPLAVTDGAWKRATAVVRPRTDFDKLIPLEATFTIRIPAVAGQLELDEIEVQRDTLIDRDTLVPEHK